MRDQIKNRGNRSLWKADVAAIIIVAFTLVLAGCGGKSGGSGSTDIDTVMKESAEFLIEEVEVDSLDAMGGGWIPLAVKQSKTDAADDAYYEAYYDSVRAAAKSGKGVLSKDRPTSNERVSINLVAMGKDPTDVEGYDLMKIVDDYDRIKAQGLNAEIYALISSDCAGYELKNRKKYLKDIVESQFDDGAFGMDENHPDADMTGMALQALAPYVFKGKGDVEAATHEMALGAEYGAQEAVDKALEWLSEKQGEDGSYGNCESTAQVILGVGMIGKDPLKEEALIKDGKTLYDGLMVYREGKGFCHAREENVDAEAEVLATEQALMALDQLKMEDGFNIFDF